MWIDLVLPRLWYPLLMGTAIALYGALLASGFPPWLASYTPVIACALVIIALEVKFPERPEWRPHRSDVKSDLAFMLLVQIALQRGLAALYILALSAKMHTLAPSPWWPQSWPLAAQIAGMVLAVEFLRYWLHRACHRVPALWRLHEVHHAPEILYTLNVGRFHPLEKSLHFACDTVPFLLLGVAPQVIAGYFVLYATNGFLQHSNLRLRYGWLNYVVGSAETHRWHHARDPKLAPCNFGNITIIWDVLFGTWHLPGGRPVPAAGISGTTYPKRFVDQLWMPFRREPKVAIESAARALVGHVLVALHLRYVRLLAGVQIARMSRDPMRAQRRLLASIIAENSQSDFGRTHRFAQLGSYEEFARVVPVSDYEALRPYVDSQIAGSAALTREIPGQYVRTSGTTGLPKDIPLTRRHLRALRRINQHALAFQHSRSPDAFSGAILAFTSPAREGELLNGKPFGAASGIVAGNAPAAVRGKFVAPGEVMTVAEARVKYLLILRLALARRDITYIGCANATTLLTFMKLCRENYPQLLQDLRQGTFFLADCLEEEVLDAVADRLASDPDRADELARLHANHSEIRIADIWPRVRLVSTWTCGSAKLAVGALRRELAPVTNIAELGYISSEFRGTVTLGRFAGMGFPTVDSHFFEFVERDAWDRGEPEFLTLDRIRKGCDYYVFVTTPSGLYRYFINDLVRVRGRLHRTPLLQFVQKGKGVTNITGEKLYESQVLTAVQAVTAKFECTTRFFMMIADEEARRYRLYVEPDSAAAPPVPGFAEAIDGKLRELNVEYAAKRESDRLESPCVAWLKRGTGDIYKQFAVQRGQREGQFKLVAIAYRDGFAFDLDAHVEHAGSVESVAHLESV
jgi:sterol desaturase/sphingolipid hydroxylase (fatty acid hydroxylase superfamily)